MALLQRTETKERTLRGLAAAMLVAVVDVLAQTVHDMTVGALVEGAKAIIEGEVNWTAVRQRALLGAALGAVFRWKTSRRITNE